MLEKDLIQSSENYTKLLKNM